MLNIAALRQQQIPLAAEPRSPVPFHILMKPIGPACNLACRYCYYPQDETPVNKMDDARLEAFIRPHISAHAPRGRGIDFVRAGGGGPGWGRGPRAGGGLGVRAHRPPRPLAAVGSGGGVVAPPAGAADEDINPAGLVADGRQHPRGPPPAGGGTRPPVRGAGPHAAAGRG
ncbi:hypothetical protein M8371_28195, partial [Klebsiella pneumoniae]|nr:hypothetical protein [Klebsiella pneumoniae]